MLYYALPYSCVFAVGIRMRAMPRTRLVLFAAVCLCILAVFMMIAGLSGTIPYTQAFKDPPTLYYLSYALFVSALLYAGVDGTAGSKGLVWRALAYLGACSMWVYLWHILMLFVMMEISKSYSHPLLGWVGRYAVVTAGAVLITLGQRRTVSHVTTSRCVSWPAKRCLEIAFLK
jgi:peptidoglycan/LPS O-acetylase OafA/YrhL